MRIPWEDLDRQHIDQTWCLEEHTPGSTTDAWMNEERQRKKV